MIVTPLSLGKIICLLISRDHVGPAIAKRRISCASLWSSEEILDGEFLISVDSCLSRSPQKLFVEVIYLSLLRSVRHDGCLEKIHVGPTFHGRCLAVARLIFVLLLISG